MEAVGRFAGGVAHDFNNMMSAVVGFSMLVLDALEPDDPLRRYVEEIQRAGERASGMTRQLLAFTRKQVLMPQVLDLNAVVSEVDHLLARLIGEDVDLAIDLAPSLHPIAADSGQLEQVIVNLAVNARDAMPAGGRLADRDGERRASASCRRRGNLRSIRASTPCSPCATPARAWTPRPCARSSSPSSRPRRRARARASASRRCSASSSRAAATSRWRASPARARRSPSTCRVRRRAVVRLEPRARAPRAARGSETVLLVEDEEVVRHLEREVLLASGYTVLEAASPNQAIELARNHVGVIDLLLTDLVMPEMSGDELARRLAGERPEMKVIFSSGYAADVIEQRGILDPGAEFLPKPLTPDSITGKVRAVLDDLALPRAS